MKQQSIRKNWWLVRHAPVSTKMLYGHLDVEADFSNDCKLALLADRLPSDGAVYTSDLQRCTQTAKRLQQSQGSMKNGYKALASLREQNFGLWEGCHYSDLEVSDPENYTAFWKDPAHNSPPCGESFADLAIRVQMQIESILLQEKAEDLTLVVHAGTIRGILGMALQLEPQKMLAFSIAPLSLTRLSSYTSNGDTTWQVDYINQEI
jgi:alpha-ribazole phosphatase